MKLLLRIVVFSVAFNLFVWLNSNTIKSINNAANYYLNQIISSVEKQKYNQGFYDAIYCLEKQEQKIDEKNKENKTEIILQMSPEEKQINKSLPLVMKIIEILLIGLIMYCSAALLFFRC